MSSPPGASHTDSGKFTAGCGTDKAMHCGHLLLHGDRQAKGGQVKSPTMPAGKIYNKRSVDYNLTQACPKTTITLTTILMKSSTKMMRRMMSLATKMGAPSSIWLKDLHKLELLYAELDDSLFHLSFILTNLSLHQFDRMRVKHYDWGSYDERRHGMHMTPVADSYWIAMRTCNMYDVIIPWLNAANFENRTNMSRGSQPAWLWLSAEMLLGGTGILWQADRDLLICKGMQKSGPKYVRVWNGSVV